MARSPSPTPDALATSAAAMTPIGVDVGERQLAVAATVVGTGGEIQELAAVDGDAARDHHDALVSKNGDVAGHREALRSEIDRAAQAVVAAARDRTRPVLVLEDLGHADRSLDDHLATVRDHVATTGELHRETWLLPTLQATITEAARAVAVPVVERSKEYTSVICARCGVIGEADRDGRANARFRCTNPRCDVAETGADRNAAANLARRFDLTGARVAWPLADAATTDTAAADGGVEAADD